MRYYSTNRESTKVTFAEAAMSGIAPDGGLYLPEIIPQVPTAVFRNMAEMTLEDIAYVVMTSLLSGDMQPETIRDINTECLTYPIPVNRLGDSRLYSCELFHGPTGSCKDLGVRYMARILSRVIGKSSPITMIASVSSDYGVAIANAFAGVEPFKLIVTVPRGRLSHTANSSIFNLGGNIHAVEVRGSIADCLAMTQTALIDKNLAHEIALTSANSINIARLLPLVIQFFQGWVGAVSQGANPDNIVFSVPCGNLSNLSAALIALKMGLPVKRLIAAGNTNCTFTKNIKTGIYKPAQLSPTIAPALDITMPINLPRVTELLNSVNQPIVGHTITDAEIISCQNSLLEKYGYISDPHTAVAAAAIIADIKPDEYGIIMATGTPTLNATNDSSHHRHDTISPTYSALKRFIESI